ncbi:MAG: endonuclease [Dysgonamonadaceae bacterium]|jgi:endonuclease I|nr:endonuclease [Dysgonamonadaceae bacterium]
MIKQRIKILFAISIILISFSPLFGQIPENYYASIKGKKGAELKTALFEIIKDPQVISYSKIWTAFESTDAQRRDRVWDMYSMNAAGKADYYFAFKSNRCGRYKKEGDCYNREHSVPRSWFYDKYPMNCDLFHIYPTDGYVNNRRGNLPLGEVGITYWISTNGSKVGQNTTGDFTSTVFEPIDDFKGDFARTYFYMATAYEDKIPSWQSEQIGGETYPGFTKWSLDMLLRWHKEDPVSLKEVRRNEAVYKIQKNRNPFIDYPQLVEYVWGENTQKAFNNEKTMDSYLKVEYSPFERFLNKVFGYMR